MIKTLSELLLNTLKEYPKDDLMLYKKEGAYVPLSTREFGDKVRALSLGLRELGLGPGDKLVILSENRPEWVMVDFATLCRGALTVPIYTTLVPEQVRYIIEDSDAKIVVYSGPELGQQDRGRQGPPRQGQAFYLVFVRGAGGRPDPGAGARDGKEGGRRRPRPFRAGGPSGQAR